MSRVEIFDPAMCCSTGVCGTDVDPALSTFAADVAWLAGKGVEVTRATLAQEPQKFVANDIVRTALETEGAAALPMVVVDGSVKSTGAYPTRRELAEWAGVERTTLPLADVVATRVSTTDQAAEGCCGGSGCC